MSLHSSLRVDTASAQQRSVLTRIERLKDLMKKGLWQEGQKVTALPKTKMVRLKTRKAKAKAAEEGEGAAPAGADAKAAAAPASK